MSDGTTTNQGTVILNGVIGALMSGGEKAAEAYLTALDPALVSIPIVTWIMDEGISYLAQVIEVAGEKFADNLVINIQTQGEESNVNTAGTALAIAIASNNAQAIAAAVTVAKTAYKAAFNFDGFGTPS